MKRVPLSCRISHKLGLLGSPSALFYCKLGKRHRPYKKCKNCPNNIQFLEVAFEKVHSHHVEGVEFKFE